MIKIPVLVSSDELRGEAAKTCSYGVEFHLLDALIGATEKIVRSKKTHFDILQVDMLKKKHVCCFDWNKDYLSWKVENHSCRIFLMVGGWA